MKGSHWVIIDTETDGVTQPIHIVELCGQMMDGWEPVGEPFQMYLNHDVPIPQETVAIHGYTRSFLRQHGREPRSVHTAFAKFAGDLPLVAHNLSFDWDRSLDPEWSRLGIPRAVRRGFCSLMLARRLVTESHGCGLRALKECFRLSPSRSHHARDDVQTVVELFRKVYGPRLEPAGINSFESVAAFASLRPIRRCLQIILDSTRAASSQPRPWSVAPPPNPGAQGFRHNPSS